MDHSLDITAPLENYLTHNTYIDCHHDSVKEKALQLAANKTTDKQIAQACFEFVRDEIKHSWDYKQNPVTCKASDVLKYQTGYCYAKSHLLAALLRANNIPAGLCYQRLTVSGDSPPFCLHGLNAVFLKDCGWYRIDARGNREDVNAQFHPPREQLAFPVSIEGEIDFAQVLVEPLKIVVDVLTLCDTYIDVMNNLPDTEVLKK